MSILTHKMKTARAEAPSSCKFWFPCNEGSGNTITDIISGIVLTDAATAEYAVPHAVNIHQQTKSSITAGTIPDLPNNKSLLFIHALESGLAGATGANLFFGDLAVSGFGVSASQSNFLIKSTGVAATTCAFGAIANNQTYIRVSTYNGVTGLITTYSSSNKDAAALDNTADASAHLGNITISDEFVIGSVTGDGEQYGSAAYYVDTLPSSADILSAINWMVANWAVGHKYLPAEFADLI